MSRRVPLLLTRMICVTDLLAPGLRCGVAIVSLLAVVGCGKSTPSSPIPPSDSPATLLVGYTGAVSGERGVSLGISSESFARNNMEMTKTGPNSWEWQGDSELLQQLQVDIDVRFSVSDQNWRTPYGYKGHAIRVSTIRGGVVLSSQETNAGNVWYQTQTATRTIYWGLFRLLRDDTVEIIPGPGEPEPLPTTVLLIEYTGKVSGEGQVLLNIQSDPFRGNRTMFKTGPNNWEVQIDPVFLRQFQEDGDVEMYVWDWNLPSDEWMVGYPIRVSTLRGGVVFSTQATNAQNL